MIWEVLHERAMSSHMIIQHCTHQTDSLTDESEWWVYVGKVRLDVRRGFALWWVKTGAINSVTFWQICVFQSTQRYNFAETHRSISWAAVLWIVRFELLTSIFNYHHTLNPESPVHIHNKQLTCAATAFHLFHIIQHLIVGNWSWSSPVFSECHEFRQQRWPPGGPEDSAAGVCRTCHWWNWWRWEGVHALTHTFYILSRKTLHEFLIEIHTETSFFGLSDLMEFVQKHVCICVHCWMWESQSIHRKFRI